MEEKIKVVYLVNIPSPYRVSFFNELGKLCELTVLFERRTSEERELSWHDYNFENFKGIFLEEIKSKGSQAISLSFTKYLFDKKYDHIVIGGYSTLTGALAISFLRAKKIPFILNIDGGMKKKDENKIKQAIKKYFISSASAWLSTGKVGSAYLEYYGAKKENIHLYPFTTLSKKDLLEVPNDHTEKQRLRKELGIEGKRVVITVGQFIYRKGFDVLIKSWPSVSKNTSIYFIGGNPTEEYLELKKSLELNNIHFLGFKEKQELINYYRAADLFVLPTREDIWGLVINEAMSNGLPVITTDNCVAGLELVKDYENGFIVPVNDEEALSKRINEILKDDKLLIEMSEQSLKKIRVYTIENMAAETLRILVNLKEDKVYGY